MNDPVPALITCLCFGLIIVGLFADQEGFKKGRKAAYAEAVRMGVAEYRADEAGNATFAWKLPGERK